MHAMFMGVKVCRTRHISSDASFVASTLSGDYYVEIGRSSHIEVRVSISLINRLTRPIRDVEISFLGLREDYHQEILEIRTSEEISSDRDVYGNIKHSMVIPILKPRRPYDVRIRYTIMTHPYKSALCPPRYMLDRKQVGRLLEDLPCQRAQHEIRSIASQLCLSDSIGAIKAITLWVMRNIRYERTYTRDSASDTLKRGRGSCLSVSDLLVSMLRVCGIPARVVRGLFMGRPHAWVEAYIPWGDLYVPLPIDALAGMVGSLGSPWISHYAEMSTRDKDAECSMRSVAIKYSIGVL